MHRVSSRWVVLVGALISLCLVGWAPAARHVRAAEFLQRLAQKDAKPSASLMSLIRLKLMITSATARASLSPSAHAAG